MKRMVAVLAVVMVLGTTARAQEADMSLIPYRHGDLWGYARPDKSIVINPSFDDAKWFSAGLAVVRKGNMYGYIDKQGKLVIPFKFYAAKSFHYGYFDAKGSHMEGGRMVKNQDTVLFAGAALKPGGNEVCINSRGETMSRCPAINEEMTEEKIKDMVVNKKEYGLVNNDGVFDKIIDDYKTAGDEHSYYIGVKNSLYGVVNNTFDIIVPFENTTLKKIPVGDKVYLQVEKNYRQGVLNANGTPLVPVENSAVNVVKFSDDKSLLIVSKDGKTGIRDFSNADVLPARYQSIAFDAAGGFELTGDNNAKGFYFPDGNLIEPRYSAVKLLKGAQYLQVTTASGKTGYVNAGGAEFFSE